MNDLYQMPCEACQTGALQLTNTELADLCQQIPEWRVIAGDTPKLQRTFSFSNFVDAMNFSIKVGHLAEKANHHPTLLTEWGKVTVTWWTHKINGLHKNDLILAAKTDHL